MRYAAVSMTRGLEEQVYQVIAGHHLVEPGDLVLVGISGGADSVCLLSVLLSLRDDLRCELAAIHVNHGMRPAAADEAAFVRRFVQERGIPFRLEELDVPALCSAWRCSPEEGARRARFQAFARILKETGADRLALAHNRDDQAETVLFKLFRGAGLRGFAGIAPLSYSSGEQDETGEDRAPFPIIRPLLFTPRTDIEAYLSDRGLDHVEDDSNAEDVYARNRIRRHVLPYVTDHINEGASRHLADAARRARQALSFIEDEARARYEDMVLSGEACGITLNALKLGEQPPVLQEELLFLALRELGIRSGIGDAHIQALLGLIRSREGTKRVMLPGGWCAERVYDRLSLIKQTAPAGTTCGIRTPGEIAMRVIRREPGTPVGEIPSDPYTKWFDCDKIHGSVVFRTRREGDWIDTGAGRRSLKKELIDRKLPASERDRIPLAAVGSEILWIAGVRRCEAYRVSADTRRILELRYTADGD